MHLLYYCYHYYYSFFVCYCILQIRRLSCSSQKLIPESSLLVFHMSTKSNKILNLLKAFFGFEREIALEMSNTRVTSSSTPDDVFSLSLRKYS